MAGKFQLQWDKGNLATWSLLRDFLSTTLNSNKAKGFLPAAGLSI